MYKLVFLYDKLMTKAEQDKLRIDTEFICYGEVSAKLYFFNDDRKRRLFINPVKGGSTELVYGGVFKLKNYEWIEHKIHSYYNNSIPFTGFSFQEDVFIPQMLTVTPILFKSLKDIENCNYNRLDSIECFCFVGNLQNKKIQKSIRKGKYYRVHSVDAKSFVHMIGDRNG